LRASCPSLGLRARRKRTARPVAKAGKAPQRLEVTATSSFDKKEEGWRMTAIDLEVRGSVPEMEASEFEKHAETAKEGCPVSNALKGNVEIRLKASFV
jgi:lipoyl-dependent peroxiredoxin